MVGCAVTLAETSSGDLLKRARDVRERAEAIEDGWMKELLEHIAQEYERASERAALLTRKQAEGEQAAAPSKTTLFAI